MPLCSIVGLVIRVIFLTFTFATYQIPEPAAIKRRLPKIERELVQNLRAVYGNNFKAMARDIKINKNQLTKKQIKKMFSKYDELYGDKKVGEKEDE